MTLEVLYEDEHLVAADKPPGLLVHRTPRVPDRTFLLQELAAQVGRWLYPVHRLDRNTSGVILFACASDVAARLQEALQADRVRKEYLVLVRGHPPEVFESRRPLSERPSWTQFRRVADLHRAALLRARPRTGRRHQIRRHLAHLAHQVIGDTSYGKGRINRELRARRGLPRMFLHAARLRLEHPVTGSALDLRAPLAEDLRAFLLRLPEVNPAWVATL